MNLADILKLAGLTQQEPMNSLSTPGSSCNQHMNPDDMRTLVIKLERPQPEQEQEIVATEEVEDSYANVPDEREVGNTHDDFSFKGFGKRKRHTHDALGNYGDNPLEESNMFEMYKNFKLNEVDWNKGDQVEAEYKRLGLDQGDDPLGGWYDTMGMSDMEIRHKRTKRIQQAYKDNALAKAQAQTSRQQDAQVAARGSEGEKAGRAVAVRTANKAAELAQQHAGEEEAAIALADPTSASAITQDKQAQDNRANTTIARANTQPTTQIAKPKQELSWDDYAKGQSGKKFKNRAGMTDKMKPFTQKTKRGQPVTGTTLPGTAPKQDAAMARLTTKFGPKIAARTPTKKRVAMPPQLKRPTT